MQVGLNPSMSSIAYQMQAKAKSVGNTEEVAFTGISADAKKKIGLAVFLAALTGGAGFGGYEVGRTSPAHITFDNNNKCIVTKGDQIISYDLSKGTVTIDGQLFNMEKDGVNIPGIAKIFSQANRVDIETQRNGSFTVNGINIDARKQPVK